jgi:site-specific recombinase XerD
MPSPQPLINQYQDYLTRAGKSPHTVRAYNQDVTAFARWFEGTSGRAFNPQAVDPRDIQDYRGYLVVDAPQARLLFWCQVAQIILLTAQEVAPELLLSRSL